MSCLAKVRAKMGTKMGFKNIASTIKKIKIVYFQYQSYYFDAKFDVESDFSIKRDLNP